MSVEVRTDFDALDREWEQLADLANASPFLRPGWIAAHHSAFGTGRLELLVVRHSGRLAGVLPMERSLRGLSSPANYHTPIFGAVVSSSAALDELARALFRRQRRLRVTLSFLDSSAPDTVWLARAAAGAGWKGRSLVLERSPYVPVTGSFEDYERRLGTKRLSNLRRLRRRLEEKGTLSIEVCDGSDRLDELLEDGIAVEASGWKGEAGTAIASTSAVRGFYREVAGWAAARGWLRLAFLRLDGRALAFDFAIEDGRRHYLLKTGFDPAYRRYAPGILIRREMIARAFATRLESYEFLGAEADWKVEWSGHEREMQELVAFARTPAGSAYWALWAYARPIFNLALRRA